MGADCIVLYKLNQNTLCDAIENVGRKGVGHFFMFANPVNFNTIYHTFNNLALYMFNSFRIERNILKNINLQNNGVRLQYGGCHHKS